MAEEPLKKPYIVIPDAGKLPVAVAPRNMERKAFYVSTCLLMMAAMGLIMPWFPPTGPGTARWPFGRNPSLTEGDYLQTATQEDIRGLLDLPRRAKLLQVTDNKASIQDVLEHPCHYNSLVLVTAGQGHPKRREEGQPFVSTSDARIMLPLNAINAAADVLEAALGRKLFPITIGVFRREPSVAWLSGGSPYALFEASSGTLLLADSLVLGSSWGSWEVQGVISQLFTSLFGRLQQMLSMVPLGIGASPVELLGAAAAVAVPAAFAAVAPPLWFCITCPAVLGLLAPLLINVGLNQAAGLLCTQMQLSDDQCFDLLVGSLGLGFVLSLASAIPIFYVCKLAQCAQRNGTAVILP